MTKKHRIMLVAPANSIHTQRWANALSQQGHFVSVVSLHKPMNGYSDQIEMSILKLPVIFGYLFGFKKIRPLIDAFKPDILHAHYATGYGLLARLVNFKPYILSVWGSDVLSFPNKSPLHKFILCKNIQSPGYLAVTSKVLENEVRKFTINENITITPFGVDTKRFNTEERKYDNALTIGTIKALEHKYGVDRLITAFALARKKGLESSVQLRIVGSGKDKKKLVDQCKRLEISDSVNFIDYVPHEKVPDELKKIDVYLALSRSESFGVAPLEASATGIPVICSNVGGLPEVVQHKKTGFLTTDNVEESAANYILRLANSKELRKSMGEHGRDFVDSNYSWEKSVNKMVSLYDSIV